MIIKKIIVRGGQKYSKALETKDFVYYYCVTSDDVLMYRKKDWELLSDGFFAKDNFTERLDSRDWTWISKDALYSANERKKEND